MILGTLAVANAALAIYDALFTRERILKYGPKIETNAAVRWMAEKIDVDVALSVGVLLPATIVSVTSFEYHLTWVLGIFVGFRVRMFYNQLLSRKYENEIQKLLAGGQTASHPPSLGSDEPPSQPPASI